MRHCLAAAKGTKFAKKRVNDRPGEIKMLSSSSLKRTSGPHGDIDDA